MREILFKAKRIDNSEWVLGLITIMWGQYHIINPEDENTAPPIDAETICQFTGLIDKNGNKIWENDIIKYHFGKQTAVIRYGKYHSCFDSTNTCHVGFFVDWEDVLRKDLGYWVEMIDCNVVGNVFDNADLVKE